MIIKTCKNCEKEFKSYLSDNQKFCSLKCRNNFMIGKKLPKSTKLKMIISRKGKKPALGKHWKMSEYTKEKIKQSQIGIKGYWFGKKKPHSAETKKKIGLANAISLKGKKQSRETIEKRILKGSKHYNWKGGISYEPYSINWTKTLKRSIRERDHYTCQLCGKLQEDEAFCVHHIDYNKNNCNPSNLITLCKKCHSKTNHNRNIWIRVFYIN